MGDVDRDLGVAVSTDGRSAGLRPEPAAPSQPKAAATNALPNIEAEGERLVNELCWRHPSGMYLWTDVVGVVQTAIAEERARHAH